MHAAVIVTEHSLLKPERAFDEYHQSVYSFALRLTQRAAVAEDITQECFLALLRAPDRFDSTRGSMKTYLFSIARNLALRHYRDAGRDVLLEEAEYPSADPRRASEIATGVAAAVAELPILQQEVLILFEYEGFTLEEISGITSAEIGTIKSRLHRARARLRRSLASYRKVETRGIA